jgi:transposase
MSEWEMRVSQRELHRLHVVRLTLEGRESVGKGAKLLGISARQMKRLRRKMRAGGVERLVHGNRGKPVWNKTGAEKLKKIIELARGRYQGLNDTHLTEKLKEKEKIDLSRPTVRRVLRAAGIAAVRKRGVKRHYKRRERKAQEGALLLWDGSPHRWFGEKFAEWSLMAAVDDATGKLLCAVFAKQEDAQSYLTCLNADHTHSLAKAVEAARAGFDAIVFVEREIGEIGTGSEIYEKAPDLSKSLTTPEEAKQYVESTGIDILAPAVCNMHGMLKSMVQGETRKRLDIARIAQIKSAPRVPLTLHGGSGTDDEDFRKAIAAGSSRKLRTRAAI